MPRIPVLISFPLLLSLAGLFIPGAASAGSWRLTDSVLLTETIAEPPARPQTWPKATATFGGWCVAWLDHRQDGALLATRLDGAGRVVDPLGIPIALNQTPEVVLESSQGCVVVHFGETNDLVGTLIPWGDDSIPRRHFTLPRPSSILLSTRGRLLYEQGSSNGSSTLGLVDADGNVVTSAKVPGGTLVAATTSGDGFLIVTQKDSNSKADLALWRVDSALRFEQVGQPLRERPFPLVSSSGNGIVLVWTHRDAGEGANATIASLSNRGGELRRWNVELPVTSRDPAIHYDGGIYSIEWPFAGGRHVLTTDGEHLSGPHVLPRLLDHVVARKGGETLHVRSTSGILEYEIARGEPIGERTLLSSHPKNELLLDASDGGGAVSLLWIERDERAGTQRLWAGLVSKSAPVIETRLLVDEMSPDPEWRSFEGAIASEGGTTMVVWSGEQGLMQRRFDAAGAWVDPAALRLHPAPIDGWLHVTPEGLIAADGFVLVVGAYSAGRPAFLAAKADRHSTFATLHELALPASSVAPHSTALAKTGSGFAIAYLDGFGDCHITCIFQYEVGLALYDLDLNLVADLHADEKRWSSSAPVIAGHGESILLAFDSQAWSYEVASSGVVTARSIVFPPLSVFSEPLSIARVEDELFLFRWELPGPAQMEIRSWRIGPSGFQARQLMPAIPDWTHFQNDQARAWLFSNGPNLLLFTNEVSDREGDGAVRRLRAHTVKPVVRTRRVSR